MAVGRTLQLKHVCLSLCTAHLGQWRDERSTWYQRSHSSQHTQLIILRRWLSQWEGFPHRMHDRCLVSHRLQNADAAVDMPGTVATVCSVAVLTAACRAAVTSSSASPAATTRTLSRRAHLRPDVLSGHLRVFLHNWVTFTVRLQLSPLIPTANLADRMWYQLDLAGQEHVVVGNRRTTRDSLVPLTVKIASLVSNAICCFWITASACSAEVSTDVFCDLWSSAASSSWSTSCCSSCDVAALEDVDGIGNIDWKDGRCSDASMRLDFVMKCTVAYTCNNVVRVGNNRWHTIGCDRL